MDEILNYTRDPDEDYYHILGCDELSSIEQINCEYKVRALACHPDKNPNSPEAANRFAVIQRAKETLCDPGKRHNYDKWRKSGICISFDNWCAKQESYHMSMHWASPKKEPMLLDKEPDQKETTQCSSTTGSSPQQGGCQTDSVSEALRRFRNYEI